MFVKLAADGGKKYKCSHREAKEVLIGKFCFSFAAGVSKTIKVKLSGRAMKQLRRKGKLVVQVRGSGVRSRVVELKRSGGRKRHKRYHKKR